MTQQDKENIIVTTLIFLGEDVSPSGGPGRFAESTEHLRYSMLELLDLLFSRHDDVHVTIGHLRRIPPTARLCFMTCGPIEHNTTL